MKCSLVLSSYSVVVVLFAARPVPTTSEPLDYSGDGSGEGEIDGFDFPLVPLPKEELEEERILWRDALGDIRQSKLGRSNTVMESIISHMNTDGLPEQFRHLTSEYLGEMITLINNRLGATPANPHLFECTQAIPERFYAINFRAYDALRHCPDCQLTGIGAAYVTEVHDLVLDVFKCLDNDRHIRPGGSGQPAVSVGAAQLSPIKHDGNYDIETHS